MSQDFGTVTHEGKTITLDEQAYQTSRLLNEYSNELQFQGDGETYMDEWEASGHTETGEKVKVVWHFEIEKESSAGTRKHDGVYFFDTLPENYDWDNVHAVKNED